MEFHLDHRVVLDQEPEFKNLYKWSLQELDGDGKKIRGDRIPWNWNLYFTASELALNDTFAVENEYQFESDDTRLVTRTNRVILAKLQPGHSKDGGGFRRTSYSMFGTARTISDFQLAIYATESSDAQPTCRAWGNVSYTTEIDFRDETSDDSVAFQLFVPAPTFVEYARKVEAGMIDELVLRVSGVDGFYSDWSPAISTDHIKVLTKDKEHKVELPAECDVDPPRLGRVSEAELYLRRVKALPGLPPEPEDNWVDEEDIPAAPVDGPGIIHRATDPRMVALLSSLRLAAWIIAALLLVLLIK